MSADSKQAITGALLIVLGQLCWNTNDALVKLYVSELSLSKILLAEGVCGILLSIIWWKCKQPKNTIHWYGDKPFIMNIWIRACFYSLSNILYFIGVMLVPLGDAICIFYYSPLLIVLCAHICLNEHLPNIWILIISIISIITGILLLYQPTFLMRFITNNQQNIESLDIYGTTALLMSGVCYTISCILIRTAKDVHVLQLELVNSLQIVIIWVPLLSVFNQYTFQLEPIGSIFDLEQWKTIEMSSVAVLFVMGCMGFGGLLCMTLGYQSGDATKVSWLEYIIILFAFLYQVLLFDDIPTVYQTIGAALVTIGCLLPVIEEIYHIYIQRYPYVSVQTIDSSLSCTD